MNTRITLTAALALAVSGCATTGKAYFPHTGGGNIVGFEHGKGYSATLFKHNRKVCYFPDRTRQELPSHDAPCTTGTAWPTMPAPQAQAVTAPTPPPFHAQQAAPRMPTPQSGLMHAATAQSRGEAAGGFGQIPADAYPHRLIEAWDHHTFKTYRYSDGTLICKYPDGEYSARMYGGNPCNTAGKGAGTPRRVLIYRAPDAPTHRPTLNGLGVY